MWYLKKVIRSYCKPSIIYGRQGDKVEIIDKEMCLVKVVGSNDGFSVNIGLLSDKPVEVDKSELPTNQSEKVTKQKATAKKVVNNQGSIF